MTVTPKRVGGSLSSGDTIAEKMAPRSYVEQLARGEMRRAIAEMGGMPQENVGVGDEGLRGAMKELGRK